ncbi:MAG: GuaB3 family IMP dehydrogenase-related protein [Actinobacteria bacterium]|nr:MAG: GuaB3 family IMP dehydrogenase-related protein [Actinomycetota bacterium]
MTEVEIGPNKRGRVAYSLDDVAIAPSRRTRDPRECSTAWRLDAYSFDVPVVAAPSDSVVSPATAAEISRLGALAVLNLEGLWTRFADPEEHLRDLGRMSPGAALARMQQLYREPISAELMGARIRQLRDLGITVAGALSPQLAEQYAEVVTDAGMDVFVIRGTTVSAEHVTGSGAPLNLKQFIYELEIPVVVGGVATKSAALHLMRAGAAGVLVGFGGGAAHTTHQVLGVRVPMATAIAEVAAARTAYLDESGGRYVHVIADGGMGRTGDIVKAVACGADAVMVGSMLARADEAPGAGRHWGMEAVHPTLPRGEIVELGTSGSLAEILVGPSTVASGLMNIAGALRRAVATCGYADLKEFQRVEVVVGGGPR